MTTLGTLIYTRLRGEEVGQDAMGNRYYRDRKRKLAGGSVRKERRWVIFKSDPEASQVPPEWHGWLHHTSDDIPPEGGAPKRPWMKEHRPNMTGTEAAYLPPGHTLAGGRRAATTSDYEAWKPE